MRISPAILAPAFLLLVNPAAAAAAQVPLDRPLPTDPAVTEGQLDNGLRYIIRRNGRPENRAELRLVVNAGSVLEDESQLGLAHLVEHMAFNGTEHFEKQELVDYLESIGMQFGPSINAFTSFDETVYMLTVPTDDPTILTTAFQILEDWAHLVSFEPEEIDKERGVVIEEWRLGRGAGARLRDQQLPIMLKDSRYAVRLPIGDPDVLRTFAHGELTRFYETWYRPDLMSVIAVGDFDVAAVEDLIRTRFSNIPARPNAADRPYFDVPPHAETYYAIASDPELPSGQVGLLTMQPPPSQGTMGDYRRGLVEQLASGMLNNRFQEISQREDPPFALAATARARFVRTASAFQLLALVSESGHERGFEALLTEAERAARHGFTEGELEREKLDLIRGLERLYTDRENQQSALYTNEYLNHFLYDEPIPGIEFEFNAARALAPGITLDEVNAIARSNLDPANRVVMVSGIEKEGVDLPTEADLRAIFTSTAAADIAAWEDTALDQPLVAALPAPGTVVAEDRIDELDVTVWTLSNGATVWLKPTDFRDDEIRFRATSPGGWSNAGAGDHATATMAATVVQQGGAGDFSNIDLQKALAGKAASVSPTIGETSEGLSGQASPKDLETLFQLIYLNFTAPREDSTAFRAFISQGKAILANRSASPMTAFLDTFTVTLSQGHPRARPMTAETLDEIDLGRAVSFYRSRFADASDFTFVFVGAIDMDAMRPLVQQYLAALPVVDRDDHWVDLDIDPPTGHIEKTVRRGVEPQSQTVMAFTGPFEYTADNRVAIRAMAQALELRLRERMREDLGGTYSVGVSASYETIPEDRYTITIQFGSDPDRAEELRTVVFDEITALQRDGPSQEDVDKVHEGELRSYETNSQQNNWWATQLMLARQNGSDPRDLADMSRYDTITAEHIMQDARRYLREGQVVIVTLLPASGVMR